MPHNCIPRQLTLPVLFPVAPQREQTIEHDDPVLGNQDWYGMIHLLHKLFEVVWREELVPPKWCEGLIKKGDKEASLY